MRLVCIILFLCLPPAVLSEASQPIPFGAEPPLRFGARDIFHEYNLPPLQDRSTDELWRSERGTQVLTRAVHLSLERYAATSAWMQAGDIYARELRFADTLPATKPMLFRGRTATELNAVLALETTQSIKITSTTLHLDVPIRIARSGLDVDFGKSQIVSVKPETFLLRVEGAENIHLSGGVFTGQGWGLLINNSHNIAISGVTVQDAMGGILVTNSRDVIIRNGVFHALQEAPILLHGDTHRTLVLENEISGNLGNSNWHAGIVITDRNAPVAENPRSMLRKDNYGVQEQKITARHLIPTDNLIAFNRITGNLSSGIYSDGGSRNVYAQNSIESNAKEGFCLDNGSSANVVVFNVIGENGKRWGKTDADLQRDFVLDLGRLPDGSSPAKLPGISLDNAAFNQILFNNIHDNYGGGIKMVRTAFYNVIGMNMLNENNIGHSERFHFFGIELGAASADVKVPDLDFQPSRGNEIFGNTIRGKHYAGIFFGLGSNENVIFDNSIFGATNWAMESVQPDKNESFNNLSNLRCRNISTGVDPNLIELGSGK